MRKKMKIVSICILITASLNFGVVPTTHAVSKDTSTTKKVNKKNVKKSDKDYQTSNSSEENSDSTAKSENSSSGSTDSDSESNEENLESSTTESSFEIVETSEESSISSSTQSSSEITDTSTSGTTETIADTNSESSVTQSLSENSDIIESIKLEEKLEKNKDEMIITSGSEDSTVDIATSHKKNDNSKEDIIFKSNQTTKKFIDKIGSDASILGYENDMYASVMIAQAILESASGNSLLASPPHYNLFGIKGKNQGLSVSFATSEDDGKGNLYTIQANFKKYSSYKESLEDYVLLIRKGLSNDPNYYNKVWKSNTSTYKDATDALTGKYATDSSYAAKLNGLIHTYDLVKYDERNFDNDNKEKETSVEKNDFKISKKKSFLPISFKSVNINIQPLNSILSITNVNNLYQAPLEQVLSCERLNRTLTKREKNTQIERMRNGWIFIIVEDHTNGHCWEPEIDYRVKKDDSLKKISNYIGISVSSLRLWNGLAKHSIYEGQILKLLPDFI